MAENTEIRCVHCGQVMAEESKDHVFPKSWYPANTPHNVQRWTVPSCRKCNGELGKIERELFIRLALCTDPARAEASGLSAKAVRSMGIGAEGISPIERLHRRALKMKIIRSMRPHNPSTETFPGFGPHQGFPADQQMEIGIPAKQLHKVAEKIVRGCEFVLGKRILGEPYELGIYFVHKHNVPAQLMRIFEGPSAKTTHLGPGFVITRAAAHDQPDAVVYKIVVWGSLEIYASILPRAENEPHH